MSNLSGILKYWMIFTLTLFPMVVLVVLFDITANQTTTPLQTSIYNLISLMTCYEHVAKILTKVDVNVLNWNGFIHKWRAQYCHLWSLQLWHKSAWTNTDDEIQLKELRYCAINERYFLIFKIYILWKMIWLIDEQFHTFGVL